MGRTGLRRHCVIVSLTFAGALFCARDADADTSFFVNASAGPGFGLYHPLAAGVQGDFGGFAFHMQACMGVRFASIFGVGLGGAFQPLIASSGFFGGGFGGACFVVAPIPRLHFDIHAGLGAVGATQAAYIGPAASAGAAFDVIESGKARMFLGLRILALPGWNAGANGLYLSPTFSVGIRYW